MALGFGFGNNNFNNANSFRSGINSGSPNRMPQQFRSQQQYNQKQFQPQHQQPQYQQQYQQQLQQQQPQFRQQYQQLQQNQPPRQQQSNQPFPQPQSQASPPVSSYDPSIAFEPLNDDVLKLIAGFKEQQEREQASEQKQHEKIQSLNPLHIPQQPEQTEKEQTEKTLFNPDFEERVKRIMQDEKNGMLFYNYLAGTTDNKNYRHMMLKVANGNKQRISLLQQMYANQTGGEFALATEELNLSVSFRSGVKFAISEEGQIINNIIELLENNTQISSDRIRELNIMLYKKINNLLSLLSI